MDTFKIGVAKYSGRSVFPRHSSLNLGGLLNLLEGSGNKVSEYSSVHTDTLYTFPPVRFSGPKYRSVRLLGEFSTASTASGYPCFMELADRRMALLTPMWQRIARGEVDLSQFTDEEILTGQITMQDGRLLPKPAEYPDIFLREQSRRGLRVAERKVREGGLKALDYYLDTLEDDEAPRGARMDAAKWLATRYLGPAEQHLQVTHHNGDRDPRTVLAERLLEIRGVDDDDIIEAEILEDLI